MISLQNVIKYISMMLAIVLAVWVITETVQAIFAVVESVTAWGDGSIQYEKSYSIKEVRNLNLQVKNCNLVIRADDVEEVVVEYNRKNVELTLDNRTLKIESSIMTGLGKDTINIVITVPRNSMFSDCSCEMDFGTVTLEDFNARDVECTVGMGEVHLKKGRIRSLGISLAVGEVKLYGDLPDTSVMDIGIGNVKADFLSGKNSVTMKLVCDIGTIKANDKYYRSKDWDKGSKSIHCECGVGSLAINCSK